MTGMGGVELPSDVALLQPIFDRILIPSLYRLAQFIVAAYKICAIIACNGRYVASSADEAS